MCVLLLLDISFHLSNSEIVQSHNHFTFIYWFSSTGRSFEGHDNFLWIYSAYPFPYSTRLSTKQVLIPPRNTHWLRPHTRPCDSDLEDTKMYTQGNNVPFRPKECGLQYFLLTNTWNSCEHLVLSKWRLDVPFSHVSPSTNKYIVSM